MKEELVPSSQERVTVRGHWYFPETTWGFRTRNQSQKGRQEQRKNQFMHVQSMHFRRTTKECLGWGGGGQWNTRRGMRIQSALE